MSSVERGGEGYWKRDKKIFLFTSLFDEVKAQMYIIYSSKKKPFTKKKYYKLKHLIINKDGFQIIPNNI